MFCQHYIYILFYFFYIFLINIIIFIEFFNTYLFIIVLLQVQTNLPAAKLGV